MEHKNKSFGRIKRHQSDKVLRYSIRKYSFGAVSVAVAALMFLGTHAVSADVVDGKNQPAIGAPNPNEEKPPLIEPALTSKNEEIKETEKVEVAKETEEREKPSENKEAVEANSLNNGTSTSTITVTKDASGDKVTEKQRLDKSQLQASITKVQELLAKVNKEKAPASTLAAIQEDLENAKNALNNNELTQAEVDVAAKKLNEKVFVLSSMPKVVAPKTGSHETLETPKTVTEIKHSLETVKEDLQKYVKKSEITTDKPNVTAAEKILENISKQLENTTLTSKELTALLEQAKTVRNTLVNEELRANSGARDSRNGQSMGEGVNFRADGVPVEGALYDVKEYISQDKYNGGGTTTGQRVRTIEKTFMTAKYSTEGNKKYITYDVYFQNDGQALDGSTGNAFWFYPPRDLLYNVGGNYPVGVVSDAYYERYEKKAGTTGILSHNPHNFTQVGGRYTVPLIAGKYQDDGSQRLWPGAGGLFQFDGGPARRSPNQVQSMLKNLKDNKELNSIIRLGNGNLPAGSYSHILNVSPKQNYAYKYHVKMRLKDDVTAEQAKTAGTIAVTTKAGSAIEASQAYVYAARGTSLLAPPTINTLAKYDGTLVSTDRVISGTGVAGATIKVKLQDGSIGRTTVNNQGNWTYTLRTNEKLTQNTKPDATIKADNAISVTQTKNGEESSATSVNVQLAKAISIDTPLQAGREITVKAAHDTGRFYVQVYNNKNDRQAAYQYGVKQEGGRWVLEEGSDKADLIVANGDNVSEKKFTLRIKDANKKTNFPFKITANSVVKVRSHYVNRDNNPANPGNDADQGWITASPATNTNPRITVNAPNTRNYTADGSLTLDGLKRLVTVADKEDDANKTVGRTANENLSVTIRQGNKDVNLANNGYLKKGEYTLTYTTTDAAGATATTNHTITVNYAAVAKPTINLLKGETLTEAEKRSLLQLQDGTSKIDVPSNARVEVTLDTSSVSNTPNGKTATATVVFADNTRTAPIPVNYKVFNTFETVTKVYDFVGVNRNDSPSSYYKNPGGLLPGMSWVVKRDNDAEFKNADAEMKKMLNADGVGTKTYSFGAKYPRGRFTDNPTSDAEKLSYTPTFTHEVFDVAAFNNPQTQKNRVEVNNGEKLSDAQAASAVVKTPSSQALPKGTTYEWVKSATDPTLLTDAEKSVTEFGEITRYVKVTLPKVSETGPSANQVQPYKIIPVTLKVNETVKPTVQMDGRRLTTNAEDNKFVIFRGATFNPTFTVNDNSGKISTMEVSGLPSGTNFVKNTETANGDVQLSGNVTATANATLGTNNVGSVKVTDARGNTETYKFKYAVVDVEVKNTPETVDKGTKLFVPNNTRESKDSHNYVKVVATPNTDGSDVYYPGGMNFKWSKNNAEITNETVFDTPGTITYNAVVKFPRTKSDKYNVDIDGDGRNENVTIYAPDKVEKTVTFKVKPTAPTVTAKDNGDVEITPANETNVDKVSVTFTPQEGTNPAEVTYTAKKNASGVWEFGSGAPLTVDPTTGVFKLKDRKVKDGTTVTAKALTTDGTGGIQSTPATGIAGNGDAEYPTVTYTNNVETDAQGNRVVYITPTEASNVDVATVGDNSGKLLEAVFFDQGTTLTDLGNYGIAYNKVTRNGDTITNAPLTLTVNGTLNKFKSANTVWNDDDVIVTRYASAMDAAENNIKDKSGSRDDVASNPYRVIFKALTQATKYTPTVSKAKIERDITQANATITDPEFNKIKDTLTFSSTRGEVKVKKDTTGLTFEIKNRTVQAKQDGSLYITATVVYPDGSRDDIDVPLDTTDANKAKPALTTKEVSVKAAKAKNEQGSVPATEYNRVLNNVTVPQAQPQPIAKEVKNNGLISEVDGKKVVTVGLTFKDNTKKDVTVPVLEVKPIDIVTTFNEKDNTVTIKPNTTVEINDRLQFGIRGKSMALTKTASGYTNSVNDRTITVNQDGSITITLVGEEKFQAGDRIVTRHESNKNEKVDSYETEAFAGLKPVEKVPAINLTALTNKEKEDVKAAVKKANPSVNTAELQVAANGDVTYRHKGAGVGTSDPTPEIRLNGNVRPANNAERYTPVAKEQTVDNGVEPKAKDSIDNVAGLPSGTTFTWKDNTPPNTAVTTPGKVDGTVVVHYPDGTSEEVQVKVNVRGQDETYTPVAKEQTVDNGVEPKAKDSIDNVAGLPSGTTFTWKDNTPPNTAVTTPGKVDGTVVVHYPDGTSEEVQVKVNVRGQDETYTPVAKEQTVDNGVEPKAKDSIDNVAGLPSGTTFTWKDNTPPNTAVTTPGKVDGTVVVHYPDGTSEEVQVKVNVRGQDETYTPVAKEQTVDNGVEPKAKDSIDNVAGLPSGTTFTWKDNTPPNTAVTTPGKVDGTVVVHYPDGTSEEVQVKVNVRGQDETYTPVAKEQTVDNGVEPKAKDSIDNVAGLPSGTTFTWKDNTPPNTAVTTPGKVDGTVVVHYPDGTSEEVQVKVNVRGQDETYTPVAKEQTVDNGVEPKAKDSIDNVAGLPSGTTFTWKDNTPPNTAVTTPGKVDGTVVVHYPDGTSEEVQVKVNVRGQDETYTPVAKEQTVDNGVEPKAKDSIDNVAGLPSGTTFTWKDNTPPNTAVTTPGKVDGTVVVHYPDGTSEEVQVKVNVRGQDETYTPVAKEQTVDNGVEPKAKDSIDNVAGLPSGTTFTWKDNTPPNTAVTTPGKVDGTVVVHYPDGTSEEVQVKVNVRGQDETYTPVAKEQTVDNGVEPKAKDSIDNVAGLPSGTTFTWKDNTPPNTAVTTPGKVDGTVVVHYPDGTSEEVQVKVNVRGQDETYTPVAKEQTVDNGVEPKAKDSIDNVAGLPSGTTFTWKDNTPPNTAVTTPGKVDGTVVVHYPDGTSEEVQVKVNVRGQDETYTPVAKEQTVDNGVEPKAKDSIDNVAGLPSGTTFTWKDNTPPNTAVTTPGKVDGTVVVHYPDGTSEEVQVKVNVRGQDETYTPVAKEQTVDNGVEPKAKDSIDNVAGLPSGTTFTWKDNTPPNTAVTTPGKVDGTVVVHYPDGTSEEVQVKVNVRGQDETYTPVAKEQTVDNGVEPKAKDSIDNVAGLPSGTTFTWKDNTPPNTAVTTPGKVDGTVVVHYPDGTSEEVQVKVNVRGQDETYTPVAKEQTVDNGVEPKAKDSIDNVAGLPSGTTFTWKDNTPPNTAVTTPGKVDGTVVVHYPDGTSEEVQVKVNVRGQDETYTPVAKEQTVDNGVEPKAKDSIDNVAGLPSGTTFTWKDNTPPNTAVTTPGKVDGTVVVHYPDGTSEEVQVKVNVRGQDETYTPVAKEQTVDNGVEPKAKDSIDNVAGLPSGTTFTWKDNTPPNTAVTTPGKVDGTVVVHYPDGTSEEVQVKVNVRGQDETYTPVAKEQTVDNGVEPKAKDSIDNVAGLPSGTTFTWKDNTPPNTAVTTPGKVDGTVVVHYPDGTSEEVQVKVNVRGQDETYTPVAKEQTVDNGVEPKAKDSIDNVAGLPSGTTFTWKDNTPPNTAVTTPGKVDGTVVVHYPDGTSEEVQVKVNVRGQDETYTPVAKEQTVDNGVEPKAKDSIDNVAGLPSGTTFTWKDNTPPNTAVTTPGKVDGTVVVHYPDGTSEEVQVKVNVRGQDETYTPVAKEQTVDNGVEPKAKDSIDNVAGLPSGTTFTWKDNTPPNTAVTTPGKVDGTVVVHYPDGTSEEVQVKVNVRGQDETYTPVAKEQTVDNGVEPKAKDSIDNVAGLPSGTTFTWKDNTPPNTAVTTPGKVDGTVVVHYPDGTSEEVQVKVNVRGQDETYTPVAKEQTVDNGVEPKAKDSIDNVAGLPSGTTFTWKDNTPPNTAVTTPGKVDGTVVVHYPDGTSEEVQVKVNVRGQDETYTPVAKEQTVDNGVEPKAKDSIDNVAGLPSGTTFTWKDNTPPNTAVTTPGKVDGTVVVHYPDGTSEEVQVKVNVRGQDETYTPVAKEQTVDNGVEPKAKDSIDNVAGLPSGTTFTWKDNTPPNTAVTTPGKVDGTVVVHYPDGTSEEVQVKVNVRGQDETYTPVAKEQTVDNGVEPKAKDSIDNVAGLPSGTTFTWKDNTPPNTAVTTPGKVDGTVVVHYPDGTSEEVQVKVNVRGQDETYTPVAKEQTVDNGVEPKAKDSIDNVAGLPSGTTFTWKDNTPPNTAVTTPGKVDGTVVVHYPDGTSEEVQVKVNVRGQDETYTPVAKEQTVDNGVEPKAKDSIDNVAGLPSGTTFTWKDNTPPNTAVTTPGKVDGTVVVHYPDGTSEEVQVKVNVRGQDETYTPVAKEQTVDNGVEPKAKDSIDNVAGLPSGTTFTWKDNTPPNTAVTTPGKVDGTVVVHYPDGTSEEVQVKVNVRGQDETYTPVAKEQTVDNGVEPKAKDSIDNVAGLPSGTTFTWKDNTPPNTAVTTPGKVDGTVVVHYPDGTSEEVQVKVNVRGQDETYTPVAKEQTVDNGVEPKAKDSIDNVAGLPSGTTFTWKDNTPPNTAVTTPGKVDGTVVVHYPDGTSEEVQVKVNVRGQDETYTPVAKEQTVDNGVEPKAKDSIDNVAGLPSGTTFTWKDNTPPNTAVTTPGKVDGTVVVHYPDGTSEEVQVKVNVRGQDETYTPVAKEQTVDNGVEPKAKDSIDNVAGLPSGTTFTWKDNTPPNTAVTTPGKVDGTVVVHYPDGTSEEVQVKVNVRGQDETYTPVAKEQTVDNGVEPKAKDSIDNVAGLPSGTTFTWKDNTPPNTAVTTPGKVDGTVVVHYPDGTSEEVQVKVNVRGQDETYTPVAKEQTVDNGVEPKAKDSIDNVAGLPSGTTFTWKDNTPPNTAVTTPGKVDGTVVVHYPDGTSEEVQVKVNVRGQDETYTPVAKEQTVDNGVEPKAKDSIDNVAGLPSGTTFTWKDNTPPNTAVTTPGKVDGTVVVHYPDGTSEEVQVKVNVRGQDETYTPVAKEQTVDNGVEPKAKDSIDNVAGLPSGTTFTWKDNTPPNTAVTTPGKVDGTVVVHYPDGTSEEVQVKVNVRGQDETYTPVAKEQTVDNGVEPKAKDSIDNVAGLPSGTTFTWKDNTPPNTAVTTPGKVDGTVVVHYPDGTSEEVQVKVNVRGQDETYTPVAKEQTVDNGVEPKAKDSIDNVAGLPSGTTFTWKDNTPPNTAVTTPGKVDGTVVVHYPDGTSEEVQVKVNVRGQDETYTPVAKEQTVDNGVEPKAKDSIDNVAGLPSGTTFTWKDNTPPNTAVTTPGKVDGTVVVHYPDGTSEEVQVKVNVRGQDETYTPVAKEQTVDNGVEPKAKDSIDNVAGLPSGTTFTWKDNTPPNTAVTTPGKVDGTVVVHYPDGTSEEVQVKVNVRGQDETYTPVAKEQTVDNGVEPKAKDSIDNVAGLPSGTTFTWKDNTPPNTAVTTPGKVDGTVVVHYPDGTSEEVQVKVNVRGQDETYTPVAKEQTVDNGVEPKAKDSIDNVAGLPSGTTFTWKDNTPPNTAVTTPGKVDGTVVVHYPDGTSEEVQVKVNVRGQDETYTPVAKEQTVDNGVEPKAKDSIDNVAGLPSGTTFTWKDNTPPNTAVTTPGKVDGTVVVHYPDGTSEEVQVKVNVRGQDETYTPVAKEQTVDNGVEPKAKDSIDNVAGLPSGTTFTWKDNTPPNTAVTTPGKVDGTVVVHYPDGTSEEVQVKVNVRGQDETYTPVAKEQTVDNGVEPKAKDSIDNVAGLPSGTTFTWKDNTPPNTAVTTPGKVDGTVVVHYPDGTSEEVQVKVNVRGQDETYTPVAKEQTVDNGVEPKAKDSIDNVAGLPSGTTFTWKDNTPPNTAVTTPGKVDGTVVVHYPDGTSEEVQVKVNVRGQDETYTPVAKEQTVDNGVEPKAKDSIDNVAGLPSGTTFTWKDNTPPNTAVTTPGKVDGTVVVHYPDGTSEEVQVKVNVRGQDETYTPVAKEQTVDNGVEPKAKDSIDNVAGLPSGTTFTWKDNTPPNTAVTTPGKVDGTVVVHYPDGTSEEVQVKVNVRGQDETYTPVAKEQTVDNGVEPKAKDSIDNVAGLPSGTTFTWKDNTPPNTAVTTPGKVDGTVVVHYPDGTSEEVQVKVNVRGQDETYTPVAKEQTVDNGVEPKAKDSIDNVAGLPSGTTFTWKDNTPPNTAVTTPGKVDGTVVVHYPDGTSEEVQVKVNVRGQDETYTPVAKEQTVDNGVEPKAKDSIDNVAGLPSGTTFTWKDNTPPNTAVTTPGKVDGTVVVHYPDGTSEEVQVKVNVRGQDETYTPVAKEQTVDNGVEPKAKDSIDNVAGLPSGTTFTWKDNTPPNTAVTTPGKVDGTVVVHYPDGTSEEVQVKVNVRGQDETYTPVAKEQTVDNGVEPKAKDSIDNVAGLPSGTTFTWKDNTPPNTAVTTPGKVDGTVVVHYPDGTSEEVQVKVNVRGQDETYTPVAKEQTVDNGVEPKAKDSIDNVAGLPSGTTFTWKDNTPPNTAVTTPGKVDGTVVVHYPDGTSEEVQVKVNVRGQDETYTPVAKEQTVDNGVEPKAKDSIDNVAGLPSGTTFTWKDNTPPNTAVTTPGKVDGTVVVHYPDGTSEEVQVKVNVRGQDETYTPVAKEQTVDNGVEPKAKDSIDNVAGLPSGTTFTWKDNTPPNTAVTTPGKVDGTVVVHYPDGTSEEVQVKVNVRGQDETYTPVAKEQTVDNGVEPKAKDSIDNVAGLPSGTTFTWKDNTPPNTAVTTPGKVDGTVVVHYPDGTSEEVQVKVNVRGQDETYTPVAKEQTVDNGVEPKAKDSIDNVAGLPSGTTFTWKDNTPPNTAVTTPGKVDGTVVVHYPDGTSEEVQVKVNVRGQDETYTPVAKEQTVDNGVEPKAKDSIDNVAGLPSGTTFTWKDNTPPNTAVTTPGKVDGTVVVHYPDGTSEEVQVKVNVRGQDETYTPVAKEQTVDNGVEPKAKDSIDNVAGLPSGTTFTWKDNTPPNTAVTTPGKVDGTVVVHYPDGTSEEVQVKVNVRGQDETYTPVAKEQTVDNGVEPKAKDSIDNVAGLPSGTTFTWKDNTPPNTAVTTPGKVDGTVVVHYPDGTSEEVQVTIIVKETNSNGIPEIQPELPEFNGGVNGELPDPVELPKVKLIITKWIDEQGNELKPADAKAPAVLGEANEALEAGEIEGYVFVRTDVNEEGDVVTHVFRKVTPTKPEGNGEQQGGANTPQPTPEVPTDNTERKPETEKPTVPDTKQAEQPTQTVDAQVAPSQNQAVLPNTGTKADRATGALGALSLLGAFGLLFAKKKKDDEEETRNN